ncbi:MAG: 50S ribosomal protein L11 methyltransferase [Ilumatobacteraceae bacterium]
MIALVLTVPSSEAELASDALWALGVLAVEERHDQGMVELWTSLGDDVDRLRHVAEGFPSRWRWHTVDIDDSVAESWRAHATPSCITSDLVVVPAWLDPDRAVGGGPGTTVVRIDPGSAFGLGAHPTTVLTLRALRRASWPGATVLDVGCGSGVLAVGAAMSGASHVEAIDISSAAMAATHENAARNGVSDRVTASTTPLADVAGTFDIVTANILAPALIELAADLRRVTAADGLLIVSGVLADGHDHVLEALAPMRVDDRLGREGWVAIILRH